MLIKDQIEDIVLNKLKEIYTDLPLPSYIRINWDEHSDDFEGTIDFYSVGDQRSYNFCVEYENDKFELVWIKEIKFHLSKNLIYSIDGEK